LNQIKKSTLRNRLWEIEGSKKQELSVNPPPWRLVGVRTEDYPEHSETKPKSENGYKRLSFLRI
jgi:hypothetical protein